MSQDTPNLGSGGQGETNTGGEVFDPTSITLPSVDTAVDIANGNLPYDWELHATDIPLAIPPLVLAALGLWWTFSGGMMMGLAALGGAMLLFIGGRAAKQTSSWAIMPHERGLDAFAYVRRRVSMPWTFTEAVAHADHLHGVESFTSVTVADDTVDDFRADDADVYHGIKGHDGRVVIPIRLHGSNTAHLDASTGGIGRMAGSLAAGWDSDLGDGTDGPPFAYYSTTRPAESRGAYRYLDRANRWDETRLTQYLGGLLGEIGEWIVQQDERTAANEWQHYLMVVVTADAIEESPRTAAEYAAARVRAAQKATQRADAIDGEPCSALEARNVAAEYWGRESMPEGHDVRAHEVGTGAGKGDGEEMPDEPVDERITTAEQTLAPEWYAESSDHLEVGDVQTRTFWVSEWPNQPDAGFLKSLYQQNGIDLDVKVYGHPRDTEATVDWLKTKIPRIDAEGMKRAEEMDVSTLTIDDDFTVYAAAYKLLNAVNTNAWGLSGYVTVRARSDEDLREASSTVKSVLKDAGCVPVNPTGNQHTLFRSASPFGTDEFATRGWGRVRSRKTHVSLGGVFGAIYPPVSPDLWEAGGMRWGRNVETGEMVRVDPFGRGKAGHMATIAPSGSGKSYFVKQAAEEWWMDGDDRTLIFVDTQGEFEDVVEGMGGRHVVIDGKSGINPMDIRPPAEYDVEATGGEYDQFRMKVDEATEWFCGIISSQGSDPSDYRPIIQQAVEQVYADAGITSDEQTHSKESPPPGAVFEKLEGMVDNTEDYAFTDAPAELDKRRDLISEVLVKLSSFLPNGKHHDIIESTTQSLSPDIGLGYIDCRAIAGQTDSKSVSLQLVAGQLNQLVKQTPGETVVVFDEAHNLLHTPEMVDWLNKMTREVRRYDTALWYATQSPQEFVNRAESVAYGGENKRQTILEQVSQTHILNSHKVDAETLTALGLPPEHVSVAKKELTRGGDDEGYSEMLLSVNTEPGWIRTKIEAAPIHGASIDYSYREHGPYWERMARAVADQTGFDMGGGELIDEDGEETPTTDQPSTDTTAPPQRPLSADGGEDV